MPPQWKWKQFCKQASTNGIFPASGKAQGIISGSAEISWLQTSALVMSRQKDHPGKCFGIFTLGHVYVVSYSLQNAAGHLWEHSEMLDQGTWCWLVWARETGFAFQSTVQPPRLADVRFWYLVKADFTEIFLSAASELLSVAWDAFAAIAALMNRMRSNQGDWLLKNHMTPWKWSTEKELMSRQDLLVQVEE